jgi:hypothetical protein
VRGWINVPWLVACRDRLDLTGRELAMRSKAASSISRCPSGGSIGSIHAGSVIMGATRRILLALNIGNFPGPRASC